MRRKYIISKPTYNKLRKEVQQAESVLVEIHKARIKVMVFDNRPSYAETQSQLGVGYEEVFNHRYSSSVERFSYGRR